MNIRHQIRITAALIFLMVTGFGAYAQAPPPHLPPGQPPPYAPGGQRPPGNQQPLEYAFRPNLSNAEYGQCLQMEKHWKTVWNQYNQLYHQARMMNRQDPRYAQLTYQLYHLKRQLDSAWNNFASRCIYFGSRDKRTNPQQ
jgi:hypothetical protein